MRRFATSLLAACCVVLAAPAQAFSVTQLTDGSYEYFFVAPSLRVQSAGDLDLTGQSFIEGVVDGFRVGANFTLDWLGGEQARQAPSQATWSGFDSAPRRLEILAGGNLNFGMVNLKLLGGYIVLAAGGAIDLGDGSVLDTGAGPIILPPRVILPPRDIPLLEREPVRLVPEPSGWAQLIAGLLALIAVARRKMAG